MKTKKEIQSEIWRLEKLEDSFSKYAAFVERIQIDIDALKWVLET